MNSEKKSRWIALFNELLDVPSPPGRERNMANLIVSKLKALGYDSEIDPTGNVLVRLGSDKPGAPIIFAAHMDEIALVVSKVESDGSLRVVPSGGLTPGKLGERVMDILGDHAPIKGVVSSGSGHVGPGDRSVSWKDCCVETGLSPKQLEEAGIQPGAAMVPERAGRGPVLFGDSSDPMIAAWTFDDRAGMAVLLEVLQRFKGRLPDFSRPVLLAFTVHEEGGCHGAKALCHSLRPEVFVAVDGCPLVSECDLHLDGRPAVWAKDVLANYNSELVKGFDAAARAAGLSLQRAVYVNANSDASAAYAVGAVPRVAVVGHVRQNSHGFEIARLAVFENVVRLLMKFLEDLDTYADLRRS